MLAEQYKQTLSLGSDEMPDAIEFMDDDDNIDENPGIVIND